MQQRRHPEDQPCEDRDAKREQEDPPVQRDLERAGNAVGIGGEERAQAPEADGRAERAADERKQDALGQELPEQASARCAERGANRELALARFGTREDQVGQVRARDEEDEADGSLQHPQCRADAPSTFMSSGVTIVEFTRRGRSGVPRFTEPSR